jgi:FAD-dependent urate hydroxylase
LLLDDQHRSTLDVDHVIAGTGFRVDVARLGFLSSSLLARIETLGRYPVLTRSCESTVPGLYFAGAHAAVSLGPSERFLAGTHNCVRQLGRSVVRRLAEARSGARGRRITAPR